MPRGGKRPGAGRKKGSLDKKKLEQLDRERLARERDDLVRQMRAEGRTSTMAEAHAAGVKLAKDVLQDFMQLFAGRAAYYQPWPAQAGKNPNENMVEFYRNAEAAVSIAKDLAPYQSPKLSAVMVKSEMVEEIVVIGGLPDDQDGGLVDAAEGDGPKFLGPPRGPAGDDAATGVGSGQAGAANVASGAGASVQIEGKAESGPLRKAVG